MNNDTLEGELRSGLGRAESAVGEAAGDIELRLRGKADELIGRVQSAYGQARDQAGETFDTVDAFVTERPYVAAALAALAGVAFGFVLGLGRPKVIVIRPAHSPRA
ncbi:MAG: CsbD family protein [Caulobacteraceae bacterium]|jgi:uncharacterized protein YjbJ (UPF0337 family)|nr:CsbD family protein [Caulobacteraceae bacterium]